ncbi:DUF2190 family protein [Photobacterium galatheae]|uniref:Recombinase RecA n=1 Tax=Photobacterium galatheae TaxID=1654360 RepID=A0A066RYX4_9GAMM|nr:capsid cement protein [Photobacterium galatheae]KDM92892.1 recombinase RecA [Photobacterium galatheae]MCM0148143.1 DUF2190 family protein [Photobacterium galatheae]
MAKNFVEMGHSIEFTATVDTAAGSPVAVGDMVAVAHTDVVAGDIGVGHTVGVYELGKASAVEILRGASVYLKDGAISDDNTGVYAGKAWLEAPAGQSFVWVGINFGSK